MPKFNHLSGAIRFALLAGTATLMAAPAFAQEDQKDATTIDTIEVTGSRLKRADAEGALPVTVIDRQTLELSGDVSVADYLRNTTFNSFGSFRPQSGSSAQSFAGLSLRGLGTGRTLILIDGRRAPVAPNVGSAQDLNSIPLAAVERIEILSDGASAIYGTDAIGGVVNIITRKDFNGAQFTYGVSNPKRAGGDTEEGSIIFGASSDRGRMMGGISNASRDIVFQRDRPWSAGGVSTFGNNFRRVTAAPGTLYGFRDVGFLAHPTNGSAVPGGCTGPGFFTTGTGTATRCQYDFTFVAADEAATDNSSIFLRGDYQVNDDWTVYLNANVSRVESFGRYAPVPSSPWPGGAPFIPTSSPNHPGNRFPTDPFYAALLASNTPVMLRHRFAATGNRDTFIDSNVYDFTTGFQGSIGEVDLDVGLRRSEFKYIDLGRNYVVGAIAQQYIADGTYNIYDPFGNDPSVLAAMVAVISRESGTELEEYFATASFDLWDLGGGTARMAVGTEYRKEFYYDLYDSLSEAGQIVGSAGNSAAGGRNVRAIFFETLFPVLENFEISVAARHDSYSDYGSDLSPKISFRWQPMDNLTLRTSFGEGFRAPSLDIITQRPAFGAATVTDPQTCIAFGQPPTCSTQITSYSIANPNVTSETSKQWSAGVAWDATDWLNMSLDYYNIKVENQLVTVGVATIINCLSGATTICPSGISVLPGNVVPPQPSLGLGIARDPVTGEIIYAQTGFANLGTIQTDGFDFNLRTNFDLGDWGKLRNNLQVGYVVDLSANNGPNNVDNPSTPQFRATLTNTWEIGDFAFAWNINHIDSTLSTQGAILASCERTPGCDPADYDYGFARRLSSWTTHDLQATWNAPWDGRVTIGVQNVLDKDPVLDPFDPSGRGFDFSLYDGYGRVPYFRYTQTF